MESDFLGFMVDQTTSRKNLWAYVHPGVMDKI